MTRYRFKRIFRILLSIFIAFAAICLMGACVGIFRSGSQPFSRESVAEAFAAIAVPSYLCLGMAALGAVLELCLPEKTPRHTKSSPLRARPAPLPLRREARLRWALLGMGILLSVCGFAAGGAADVLTKAINICTECIGLG